MNNLFGFPFNSAPNSLYENEGNKEVENNNYNNGCKKTCPTIYAECKPIVTCSKQVIDQYHITKQPYIHTYHTEVVHHHITENEFIPRFTCSEKHVNDTRCPGRM